MTTTATPATSTVSAVTGLPHWETIPADIPAATDRDQGRHPGTDRGLGPYGGRRHRRDRVLPGERDRRHPATRARGEEVWPVIDYADIAAGTVSAEQLALLKRRGLRRGPRSLRPGRGRAVGPRRRGLRRQQRVLRGLHRPGRRLLRQPRQRDEQARDLPDLLVQRPDGGPPAPADGHGPGLPELPVDRRVRRSPVVRSRGRHPLPRPDPSPSAGRDLRWSGHPPGPGHPGPVDDRGLPAALPAPVLR